ncbi:MAG: twin-arginine translocation signal domain-containing protein, partial [Bacteroidales bacterium]|nr:twin-arginine translocation signal domain-containing protein [Bacteroidales bacterium]
MKDISRRDFLKILGAGTVATAATRAGCKNDSDLDPKGTIKPQKGQMTYRTNPKTGDTVSLLGFGMMRLPVIEEDGPSGA